jgi:hypothetical protein
MRLLSCIQNVNTRLQGVPNPSEYSGFSQIKPGSVFVGHATLGLTLEHAKP